MKIELTDEQIEFLKLVMEQIQIRGSQAELIMGLKKALAGTKGKGHNGN